MSDNRANYDTNFFSSDNVSIAELANIIKSLLEYNGEIKFNGHLDGQMRRDVKDNNDTMVKTPLVTGLYKTIQWYIDEHINNHNSW
jgi:hypothetical protein